MHTDTLELVGQIYDAVSEPKQWNHFLDNLTRSMGALGARMRMLDKRGNCYSMIAGNGHDASYDERYAQHFTRVDPWNPILNAGAPGALFNSIKVVPYREFRLTEIYNDFYRDYDMFYGLGGNIAKSENVIARIGVHRSRSQGEYGEVETQLLQTLMPHLLRAFKLGTHMESLQTHLDGIEKALYGSTTPMVLIDESARVAFINQSAETVLGKGSGLSVMNDQLTTVVATEQEKLLQLLQQAVSTGAHQGTGSGGAIRLTNNHGKRRYNLLITPYPDRSVSRLGLNRRICAAIFIHDTQDSGRMPSDTIKTLYGLTRSEIRLAEGIMEGLTPAEAAARFGVSVNTTRSQLRSLFAKTDTQRQAELVRLLMGLSQ